MATTSPDSIYYPVAGDQIAPLETIFANQSSSVQTALTNLANRFPPVVATDAARATLFPAPVQGNRVFRSDKMYHEAYFGLWSSATNPSGAKVAGWYPVDGNVFGKIVKSAALSLTNSDQMASFDVNQGSWNGMWTSTDPTKLTLPIIGLWQVQAWATTTNGSAYLLRTTIVPNGLANGTTSPPVYNAGSPVITTGYDLRSNVSGVNGVTDPMVNPSGVIAVTNTTSYIQLAISNQANGVTTSPGMSMWARYLGPERGF